MTCLPLPVSLFTIGMDRAQVILPFEMSYHPFSALRGTSSLLPVHRNYDPGHNVLYDCLSHLLT
jgi:hypothetical protein